jgi:RNA polymerase sigma-70 factor (ECF subfamily)
MNVERSNYECDDLNEADEHSLVEQMRSGDEAAYSTVVRRYWPQLIAVARRYLASEQDAQDAVQDGLLSAFRALDQFQQRSRLGTWLHRIVVNAALMKLRSQRRRPERSIDDLLPTFMDDGHMTQPATQWQVAMDTAANEREIQEVVQKCIDQLPESYRMVLLLRDIEERNTEEAAKLLGISRSAVKTRLHRARQALRTLLDPYMTGTAS